MGRQEVVGRQPSLMSAAKLAQASVHPSCPLLGQHSARVAGLPGWGAGDFSRGRIAPAVGEKGQPQTDDTGDSGAQKSELGEGRGPGPEPFTPGCNLHVCLAGPVQCGLWDGPSSELRFNLAFYFAVFCCSLIVSRWCIIR